MKIELYFSKFTGIKGLCGWGRNPYPENKSAKLGGPFDVGMALGAPASGLFHLGNRI
jgi:hypothetical protein